MNWDILSLASEPSLSTYPLSTRPFLSLALYLDLDDDLTPTAVRLTWFSPAVLGSHNEVSETIQACFLNV